MGAQERFTSTMKSPFVVVNFTRNSSGAVALASAGFINAAEAPADFVAPVLVAGAPVLVAGAPVLVGVPAFVVAAGAAAFGAAFVAGGGVCASSAAPEIARVSRTF